MKGRNEAKTPAYFRARIEAIESLLSSAHASKRANPEDKEAEKQIVLLRNGVIEDSKLEEETISALLKKKKFSDQLLSFSEITRYNTWFAMHPEKIAGKEVITTSRNFPLTIEGTKEDIIRTIRGEEKSMSKLKLKALALKLKIQNGLSGLVSKGLSGLEGLGELIKSEITANLEVLKKALEQTKSEKEYSDKDKLSFDEVVNLYNKGITEDEIKAWVWYKRSLGVPMKGWDKYYLPNTGEAGIMLYTVRPTTIKDNHFRDLVTVGADVLLGKPTKFTNEYGGTVWLVFTALNGDKQYVSEKDIKREQTKIKTDPKALEGLVKKGVLFYHEGDLEPYPIYAYGNMYDRQLQLDKDKDYIISTYGEKIYNSQKEIIQKATPELLSIANPDERMRPKILAISDFASEFYIHEFREDSGIELDQKDEGYSLAEAFKKYLNSLEAGEFKDSSAHNIIQYYLEGKKITDKKKEEEERKEIKTSARNEGEELFSKFLHEALSQEDQQKLNYSWNRTYNGQSSIAYHRIPIGFECSAKFKQFNLQFTPVQREGVAFIEAVGSGIVAYDVGVGKTMTAIIALAQAIYSGKAKRPLIVVPNPTYGKWIKEIIGYSDPKTKQFVPGVLSNTGITVNEWYNLGKDIQEGIDLGKKVPKGSITVVTYEGFKKIGFSEKVMDAMFVELTNILYQSDEKSDRDKEIDYQKYREVVGSGIKGTDADIDTLGIDYIVIDEAHRCKNIFDTVKADKKGAKRFGITGAVSETGLKAFFLCNYIQRTYGRNVMLLTATPFTNSPLEIYSMLSLVAYQGLRKLGITTIKTFFDLFVQEKTEYVINYKEEIVSRDTVKSFNNRLLLQKLIYNHINYKTGEEAGVKRPCKINLPRVNILDNGKVKRLPASQQVLTYLKMTPLQREYQNVITDMARSAGRRATSVIFRAMSRSLDNALSPFLYQGVPKDYKEFVRESPKIKYVMECIRSVKDWHEERNQDVSGQIIYLNRGKNFFPMIKEYLDKELGYKKKVKWNKVSVDEVEIISSEMSQTRKENVKEAFLDGAVKVIIGTSTIREGIDLQRKGTVLYNCYPDWNPTDIRQLEGRIWRQGNEFGYVRVVMPLVQDSMDVFVFQKLEEKTSRINDIWYRGDRGNVLDLESLDPEEIKFALLTDPEVIAEMKLKQIKAEMERRLSKLNSNLDALLRFDVEVRQYFDYRERCLEHLKRAKQIILETDYEEEFYNRREAEIEKFREANQEIIKEIDSFFESAPQPDKELLRVGRSLSRISVPFAAQGDYLFSEFKFLLSNVKKAERTILIPKGFTINDDINKIIASYKEDQEKLKSELENADSESFFKGLVWEATEMKSAMAVSGGTVEERARDFAKLNYLISYKASDVDNNSCILPDGEIVSDKPPSKLKLKALALKLLLELDLEEAA
jgi:superfamily II DNA/RNA helicase